MDLVIEIFFILFLIGIVIYYLTKNKHSSDDKHFSQAGVSVNYIDMIINIKGTTYPVSSVRGLRWESGGGKHQNQSIAIISIDDMRKPIHKIGFITPSAAESFLQRLTIAIEKAGGPTFTF